MTPKEKKSEKVGEVLRKEREKQGLRQSQVELATKIRGKYLTKLEEDDYSIPNDVYIRGFVQAYANYLGLDGPALAKQYSHERGEVETPERSAPKPVKSSRVSLTPKLAVAAATVVVVALIGSYLAWQFSALAAAPRLEISSPVSDEAITGSVVDISGQATPGTDIFINDSPILADNDGKFSDKLALSDGLNTIQITAKNKLGKSTTVTRNILAHLPPVAGKEKLVPAKKFNGIAVGVKIKDKATLIVVEVDGQEVFRGTMLAGTTQAFTGKDDIKVTTGNAGSTALIITNKVVAEKTLDPLGKQGETKRDLDFAKDTVIQ